MWFQNFLNFQLSKFLHFSPLLILVPCSFSLAHQSTNITMMSTLDPDAKQHQCALQSTMQAFIRLMTTMSHTTGNTSRTWNSSWTVMFHSYKDVSWKMWWKWSNQWSMTPECKFLHPTESTEESNSNECMPQEFDTPSKANIMAEFPKEMLTPEVRTNIANVIKHMEASHSEAAELMKCMKKLIPTIPVGAFHLILQAMVQPCIMIQHWQLCCIKLGEQECPHTASLVNMVPDGSKSQNLPVPVQTLAAILHYQVKNEAGNKVSIT